MATNKILPFAGAASNVLTQTEYSGDAERTSGHTAGSIARSALQNKVLKQASLVAAALGEFVADNQAEDVDDAVLDVDGLAAAIAAAILASVPDSSTTVRGKVELATNAETQTGTDAERAVTPAGLSARTATTTRTGLVELATNAETQTGTDAQRGVTPAGLASRTATTTRTGIVELATDVEAAAGTDEERAVTPAALAAVLAAFAPAAASTTLPGGLIVKTGTAVSGAAVATVFAAAFPHACFTVQAITEDRSDNLGMQAISASGFTLDCNNNGRTVYWLAVGW